GRTLSRPAHARSTQRPGSRAAPPGGARGARHAVLLAALLGGCGSHRPPPAPPPPQVGVVVLHEQPVPLTRELVGRLSAMRAAAVQQARAVVGAARISLSYATVTAPIAGRAGQQGVTEGALVGQGTPTLLTTVEQIDPIYVNFDQPAVDIERLRRAQTTGSVSLTHDRASVELTLPDGSAYAQRGTLDFRDASVDPATGAVALRALVPNPEHQLLPGMFVGVRLTSGVVNRAFLVPQAALQRDGTGPYVLTVGPDDKVVEKRVAVEALEGPSWIVTA